MIEQANIPLGLAACFLLIDFSVKCHEHIRMLFLFYLQKVYNVRSRKK